MNSPAVDGCVSLLFFRRSPGRTQTTEEERTTPSSKSNLEFSNICKEDGDDSMTFFTLPTKKKEQSEKCFL